MSGKSLPELPTVEWLTPAVLDILAEHQCEESLGRIYCFDPLLDDKAAHGPYADMGEWREHVAPIVADHVRTAIASKLKGNRP